MNSFQYACALQALLFVGKEPFPTIYVDSQKEDEVRFLFEFLLLKPVHSNLTNKKKGMQIHHICTLEMKLSNSTVILYSLWFYCPVTSVGQ